MHLKWWDAANDTWIEKAQVVKSLAIGCYLNLLHNKKQYQQLTLVWKGALVWGTKLNGLF